MYPPKNGAPCFNLNELTWYSFNNNRINQKKGLSVLTNGELERKDLVIWLTGSGVAVVCIACSIFVFCSGGRVTKAVFGSFFRASRAVLRQKKDLFLSIYIYIFSDDNIS